MRSLIPALLLAAALAPALAACAGHAPRKPQLVIAHRGASEYAPENTYYAFDLAMAMDADFLECDLHLTKDGVFVCIHDSDVDRTTGNVSHGEVAGYTLAQLRKMDFGSWFNAAHPKLAKPEYAGAKIVVFEEQLDCYLERNPHMRFHTETKENDQEQALVALLKRKGLLATGDLEHGNVRTSTILIQSFKENSLEKIKQLAPTLPTADLTRKVIDVLPYVDVIAPEFKAIDADPDAVARYHAQGHDVHAWTVTHADEMQKLLDLGVDGMFVNETDTLRAEIDRRGTGTSKEERGNPADFTRGCPGIQGRVTSADGPGDVWAPTGTRGVQRIR